MSSVSIKWNSQGFEDILNCDGASEVCQQEAARIMMSASSAGGEYSMHEEHVVRFGKLRVAWYVKAEDKKAIQQCSENKVLEGSI